MRRRLMMCSALLVPLVALVASPAAAAQQVQAAGAVTRTSFTVTSSRAVGSVTLLDFLETDALTGTFSGTSVLTGQCIVFSSGEARCMADETFTGTIAGEFGTMDFKDLISLDMGTGVFDGRFTITGATGELTNIHGRGTFSGTGATGTYSGTLVIAP